MALAPPLVGRAVELEWIDSALDVLSERQPGAVAIEGEPGIGKTRLLAELCERAEARDCLVLGGQAAEFERDVPFSVLVEAFDPYLASHHEAVLEGWGQELIDELASIFPALRSLAREPAGTLGVERYRAHRAARALLERLAGVKPLVVAFDDLHWADDASIELIAAILRRPPEAPVLMALAYRPGQAPERLAAALASPGMRHLEVGPLTEAEAAELLGDEVDEERRAGLYRDSGGNPFYLEQLARSGGRRGRAVPARPSALGVPPLVAAALAEELESLSPRARQLLDAAAVAGDPFEPDVVTEIAELSHDEGLDALDELSGLGVIHPTQAPRRFVFRHPIVRRAVYERVGEGWRMGAHERAAHALERRGASAAERAHHIEHSAVKGDPEAIALLIEAGQATAARAPSVSARWFESALALVPDDDRELRIEVLWKLAHALRSVGELERCRGFLLEAIERLPAGDPRAVELIAACAELEHWLGRHEEARRRLTRGWDQLAHRGTPEAAALAVELSLDGLYWLDFERARELGELALETARGHGDRSLIAAAAAALALGEAAEGRISDARAHRADAVDCIDILDDAELAPRLETFYYLAWTDNFLECWEDALAHVERGIAVSRATGQGRLLVPIMLAKQYPLQMQGRLAESVETCEEAVEVARVSANPRYLFWAYWELAWAYFLSGDLEEAIRAAERSERARPGTGNLFPGAGEPGWTLGMTLVEAGEVERGYRTMLEGIGGRELSNVVPAERSLAWVYLSRADLARGAEEDAEEAVRRAEENATGLGKALGLAWAKRARAELLLARGDPAAAAAAALESVAAAEKARSALDVAGARGVAGQAFAEAGDRERALPLLREAERDLSRFGMKQYCAQVRRTLRALGARAEPRGRTAAGEAGVDSLSDREREIAELVTQRKTNKEIAAELFLSEKTVESHLRNVFAKLSVSSRVEVARAVERAAETP
jgi:DNA-binding NarL/FixJ family response regulator